MVGAHNDDDNGSNSGAAYVFAKPGTGWATTTETAKLTAFDGAADDQFGYSVAVEGDTVVVSAYGDDDDGQGSGSAYVFVKPSTGWSSTSTAAKLTASDGDTNDRFGKSVAVDETRWWWGRIGTMTTARIPARPTCSSSRRLAGHRPVPQPS